MKTNKLKPTQAAQHRRGAAAECEQENRLQSLNSEDAIYWTEVVKAVAAVIPTIAKPKRTCSYHAWSSLLNEYCGNPPSVGIAPDYPTNMSSRLMSFAEDVAKPGWPEPISDLIEFALAFLEADVMLFRSGYTKRHLVKRLQQSPLSPDHIIRIDRLLRRAVTNGTGLEEFRAYRRLAAHLVVSGALPDLPTWLAEKAHGAIRTVDRADGEIFADLMSDTAMSDADRDRVTKSTFFGRFKWGMSFSDLLVAVPAGKLTNEDASRTKDNAYLMLRSIQQRQFSERKTRGC